ncbi:MAG: hypothetical protein ACI3XQ_02190 [Eubacteriales bacterium]
MKKLLSVVLLLALIMSFPSCKDNSGTTNTAENTTQSVTNGEKTESEEDIIKNAVLDLMKTSESQKDPTDLFAHFTGDFQITNFTSSQDGIKSIKRKEAVTLVDAGSLSYYVIEAAGYMFCAVDDAQEAEVFASLPLSADASNASTIFTVFGIDTSALYTATTDSTETEALTANMLTVTDDKAYCQFDKAYIDTLAEELCETMGFTGSTKSSFMNKYTGSGTYSVAENKVTFDIQIKDNQIGSIHQIIKYAIDNEGKVYAYSYMEYFNASLGISTPIIVEIECKDVVYRENDPISATIILKNSSESSFLDSGVTVKIVDNIETTFRLDCTNLDSRSATATRKKKQTETAMGESMTFNSTFSLSLDLGKSTAQFQFTEKQDNETLNSLKANKVTFATSPSIVTPQRVTDKITTYINKHFAQ